MGCLFSLCFFSSFPYITRGPGDPFLIRFSPTKGFSKGFLLYFFFLCFVPFRPVTPLRLVWRTKTKNTCFSCIIFKLVSTLMRSCCDTLINRLACFFNRPSPPPDLRDEETPAVASPKSTRLILVTATTLRKKVRVSSCD